MIGRRKLPGIYIITIIDDKIVEDNFKKSTSQVTNHISLVDLNNLKLKTADGYYLVVCKVN